MVYFGVRKRKIAAIGQVTRTSTRELPEDMIKLQDTGSHVRTISRSKSLDASASVKLVNSCHMFTKGDSSKTENGAINT